MSVIFSIVMSRLGLAIHEFPSADRDVAGKLVDPKAKPWDDEYPHVT